MAKVHIGHSTMSGGSCGRGASDGQRDITVSARAFFREIARKDRCGYCNAIHYPHGGSGPERTDATLDEDD